MLDVIIGENVPGQLISLEAFQRCSKLLKDNGTLITEHGAVHSFADNSFIPSVVKKLSKVGFQLTIFNPLVSNKHDDLLLIVNKNKFEIDNKYIAPNFLLKGGLMSNYVLPITTFDNKNANILTYGIKKH